MKNKLVRDLRRASAEIRDTDVPGNVDADIPAMVLTDLAALALEQWRGDDKPMDRSRFIATLCGNFSFMLERFTLDDLPQGEMLLVRDAVAALDALAPDRSRVPHEVMQVLFQLNETGVPH
ncbi:MAG: hypothetical protein JNN06_03295 [Gemmobacter sp.]|uniref:hypothetical protein n=1 Tax=Gemmobacter sp. TaxID=1898957 RepID=UPI001A4EBA58|nr:hypothetical protein [Gemmobacter sp.]MBL8561284.1 hypothetical protein [Gemmobacter sp.]